MIVIAFEALINITSPGLREGGQSSEFTVEIYRIISTFAI
jgi:hypothetical protein